jgi:hypothetical protein
MTKHNAMRWLIWSSVILSNSGCVSLPSLPTPAPLQECVEIPAPAPLAKDIAIDIKGGELVELNEGGERLLRQYGATREAILQAWPK